MRVKDYRKTQRDVNEFCVSYSSILKRRKTRTQWIVRCLITLCIVVFLTGFFTNLTGLNAEAKAEGVSAQERVNEFNPVKSKKVVVVIVVDQEQVQELLEKIGVHNETRITE